MEFIVICCEGRAQKTVHHRTLCNFPVTVRSSERIHAYTTFHAPRFMHTVLY